jgi:hypothetical protein
MKNINKLKLGIVLAGIIAVIAYVLDDIFYYAGMQLAEIFVFPIAIIIIIPIIVFLVLPYFIKK